jgi:hypothetical protein
VGSKDTTAAIEAAARAASYTSSTAEADRHRSVLDDDGHATLAFSELQHPFEIGCVLLDLEVFERNVPPGVILTGGFRVRSRVFTEDQDRHAAIVSGVAVKYFTYARRRRGSRPDLRDR